MIMINTHLRPIIAALLLISLIVLSFFIFRPVILSVILALLLAFVFSPVYDWLHKKTKMKNVSAILIIIFLILIVLLPLWFLTPVLISQSLEMFQLSKGIDFEKTFQAIFPSLFSSDQFSREISSIFSSFTADVANNILNYFVDIVLNLPIILLHLVVIVFTFFFVLREKEFVVEYVKTLLPFSKEIEERIIDYSKGITASIIYGQVIIGIVQGLVFGLGLFIFGVPNALFLTLLASLAGMFPVVGPFIVWVPVVLYLFATGSPMTISFGILLFGILSSTIDNFLRPIIVSRRTRINSAILMISMIGGLFFFGVIGLILGPLIISYLLILLEVYRGRSKSILVLEESKS